MGDVRTLEGPIQESDFSTGGTYWYNGWVIVVCARELTEKEWSTVGRTVKHSRDYHMCMEAPTYLIEEYADESLWRDGCGVLDAEMRAELDAEEDDWSHIFHRILRYLETEYLVIQVRKRGVIMGYAYRKIHFEEKKIVLEYIQASPWDAMMFYDYWADQYPACEPEDIEEDDDDVPF